MPRNYRVYYSLKNRMTIVPTKVIVEAESMEDAFQKAKTLLEDEYFFSRQMYSAEFPGQELLTVYDNVDLYHGSVLRGGDFNE